MEITTTETDLLIDSGYVSDIVQYFVTPEKIHKSSVSNIGWIDTVQFLRRLYCFSSNGCTYLLFDDDRNLKPPTVMDMLKSTRAIKEPKGYLCEAVDKTDAEYGVSPDHDPFHDDYTYLWCCEDRDNNGES